MNMFEYLQSELSARDLEGSYKEGGRIGYDNGGPVTQEEYDEYVAEKEAAGEEAMDFETYKLFKIQFPMAAGGRIGFKDGTSAGLEKILEGIVKDTGPWEKTFYGMGYGSQLYDLLAPYIGSFFDEGGRVGFKEGKGPKSMMRRRILQGIGALIAAAATRVPGLKLLSKPVKDIGIKLKKQFVNDDVDYGTSGLMNFDLVGKTKAGKEFLKKFLNLKKGVSSFDDLEPAMAKKILKAAKKNKLSTSVDDLIEEGVSKVKGGAPDPTYYARPNWPDKILGPGKKVFKRFKERFNKQTTKENIDDFVQEGNWHYDNDKWRNLDKLPGSTKIWSDPRARSVIKDTIDIITKKAEGGRIGLDAGGPPINPSSTVPPYSTNDPEEAAKEIARRSIEKIVEPAKVPIDKDIQLMFDLNRAKIGGTKDLFGGEIDFGINKGFGRDDLGYGFNWSKKFSDGGSVLQRPMFYQGGLTKTVPPKKGPMPQGLQSDVYDGIMRPGVINGRN